MTLDGDGRVRDSATMTEGSRRDGADGGRYIFFGIYTVDEECVWWLSGMEMCGICGGSLFGETE